QVLSRDALGASPGRNDRQYSEGVHGRLEDKSRNRSVQIGARPELEIEPLPDKERIVAIAREIARVCGLRALRIDPSSRRERTGIEYVPHELLPRPREPFALRRLHRALCRVGDIGRDPAACNFAEQSLRLLARQQIARRHTESELDQAMIEKRNTELLRMTHGDAIVEPKCAWRL